MLHVGDSAPDFLLSSNDGTTFRLSDQRGKKIVLYFYPKDNTPGCTKEACSFQENLTKLRKKNVVLVGVSTDTLRSHSSFAQKYGLSFPLLSDEKKEVVKRYGVWKKKSLYGKTYYGIERTTFIINEEGVIVRIFPKVKVDGHVDEVLAELTKE